MTTTIQHSAKFIRRRRSFMVLPVLVIPIVLIAFKVIGGGKQKVTGQAGLATKGYNMTLPGAVPDKKETFMDKMGFYQQRDEDSLKYLQRLKQDPYHTKSAVSKVSAPIRTAESGNVLLPGQGLDPKADSLLKKLGELRMSLQEQPGARPGFRQPPPGPGTAPGLPQQPDLSKMEKLLRGFRAADTAGGDHQIERINAMLEKFNRIQHPEEYRVHDTVTDSKASSELTLRKDSVLVRDLTEGGPRDSIVAPEDGFYTIDDTGGVDSIRANLILAIVPEAKTVLAGSTLTLRLEQDALINGVTIPKGSPLSGKVSWQNDRLILNISSIRWKNTEFLVSLRAFDMDGLEGLNIPGSVTRDISKESAEQGIGSLGVTGFNPSLGAQATNAGIQAARSLISRKVRLVRGYVRAGYQVFLQNTKISSR